MASSGFSNATVWCIEVEGAPQKIRYALKCIPGSSMTQERLAQIHWVQTSARSPDLDVVPELIRWTDGNTFAWVDPHYWELSTWRTGAPVAAMGSIEDVQLHRGIQTIAKLHANLMRVGTSKQLSPGIADRLSRLQRMKNDAVTEMLRGADQLSDDQIRRDLRTIIDIAGSCRDGAVSMYARMPVRELESHWIARDLWREHVLFDGGFVSGIIDFGATHYDWPGLDLARIIGSWLTPTDPRWNAAIELYNQCSRIRNVDSRLVRWVDWVSTWLSGFQWLEWLKDGALSAKTDRERVAGRVHELAWKAMEYQMLADFEMRL